jgi:regulator of replication initiation timing
MNLGDKFSLFATNTTVFDASADDLDKRLDFDAPGLPGINVPDELDGDDRKWAIIGTAVGIAQATHIRHVPNSQLNKTELLASGLTQIYRELRAHQKKLNDYRKDMPDLATLAAEVKGLEQRLAAAEADATEKTAALRVIDREGNAKRVERLVDEAREQERAKVAAELTALRAISARLRSENDDLRAGKKKLREALDRAKGGHTG